MATVLELRKAGYSEEEIASWLNTERETLTNAGYNQVEQSNHFGIPFKSKSKTLNSLIGNTNTQDIVSPLDANLNSTQLQEKEHEATLNVDNTTKEKRDNKIIQYEELLNNNINANLQSNDNVPYNFDQLDKEAFANRNAINLDVNEKIYDNRGVPVSEEYYSDFTLNEDLIKRVRDSWDGTFVIKGILSPKSTKAAMRVGADGIIISNHGGRQLDSAPSTIEALPQIVNATDPGLTVMLDSGVRCGTDIIKAFASGASFTFTGRTFMYGLGALNEQGAGFVLDLIMNEVDKTLAQIGCKNIVELNSEYIWHNK